MASVDWVKPTAAYLNLDAKALAIAGPVIEALGTGVQAAIEKRIGRTFDVQEYTESYDGNGKRALFLRHDPVVSVSSLTVNGAVVTVGDPLAPVYPPETVVIRDRNALVYTNGNTWAEGIGNVIVTYTAGFGDVPPSLITAGVQWIASIFRDRDRIGIAMMGAGGQNTTFTRDIPKPIEAIIAAYVRWDGPC